MVIFCVSFRMLNFFFAILEQNFYYKITKKLLVSSLEILHTLGTQSVKTQVGISYPNNIAHYDNVSVSQMHNNSIAHYDNVSVSQMRNDISHCSGVSHCDHISHRNVICYNNGVIPL